MSRLYICPVNDKLLLLHADQEACQKLDSGASPEDINVFARTIDTSLILTINDDGTVTI